MLDDVQRRTLKLSVHEAIRLAGGQENAVNVSGRIKRPTAFSEYGNPKEPDRHIPIDVAIEIDAFNPEPVITAAMAGALGYGLVSLPSAKVRGSEMGALARSIKEAAESISALSEAMSYGGKPRAEVRAKAIKELRESVAASLEAIARLEQAALQERAVEE